jgi:hypothetical protein
MKYAHYLAAASLTLATLGCASAPRVAVQEPVGPCERVAAGTATSGTLVVYSARRLANVDPNVREFFWNNDFGKNEFLYEPAHTRYTVYGPDGKVLKKVRNAIGKDPAVPTTVALPPGTYTVEAQAEEYATVNMTVSVPVVIEAGQTTSVHLEPTSERPAPHQDLGNTVRLADGRVVGCRANELPAHVAVHSMPPANDVK